MANVSIDASKIYDLAENTNDEDRSLFGSSYKISSPDRSLLSAVSRIWHLPLNYTFLKGTYVLSMSTYSRRRKTKGETPSAFLNNKETKFLNVLTDNT